jgi:L-ascorbate metabolism protein UlaG (beta-lactamase superfamily)
MLRTLAVLSLILNALPASAAKREPNTKVTWYGHATFRIETPKGLVLVVDPWFANPKDPDKDALAKIGKVDYVLVSHGHSDHVADAVALGKAGATLVSVYELSTALQSMGFPKDHASIATAGNIGGTIALGDEVKVTIVPAVHGSGLDRSDGSLPVYSGSPAGFIIEIKNGPTIYHTGDTDAFQDMRAIGDRYHPDVMLACIGGHFTMDPQGAALAASYVRPGVIVPMHFGTFPLLTGTPDELRAALKTQKSKTRQDLPRGSAGEVVEMKPGETHLF